MQRFKSHKIVTAARIIEVGTAASGALGYLLLQGHSTPVPMPMQWWFRHSPERGGYLVQYEDGYSSYSPAKAFEEGYHMVDDSTVHPVWPLRTSCEPEQLQQAVQVTGECPACPLEVRDLFAVAHNITVRTPTIGGGDLLRAVKNMQPLIDRHFANREHSHPSAPRGQKPPIEVAIVTHVRSASFEQPCSARRPLGGRVTMYELRFDRYPSLQLESTDPRLAGRVPEVGDKLMRADDGEERILEPMPELPARVTYPALEAMFASVAYEIRPDGRTTVCEITFKNGFSVRGESSTINATDFNKELGEAGARERAMDKAFEFATFLLMEDRHRAGLK